ncbi:ABC transporter substrate binding protein [Desulfovibrio sp. UCD-KL4C]|uniref:ABC transporter substrate binding protein n=1 Tax=Desulfovibrio sp. UCD-KL4C TaxID=2578120 RepID=UPI0025C48D91|nr:ABC transporter substrate binding protein [Desulfovibrio sp. UCD-KL4C]
MLKQIQRELSEEPVDIVFDFKIAQSWESYKKLIFKLSSDPSVGTIYPAATLLKDENGVTHATTEIIKWTVKNSRKPEIPINYSFAQLGMLGGAGVDFISMGRQAGTLVSLILNGHKAGDLPIEDAKRYAFVFNLNRAKELGITIPSDILMAADVIYR